MVITDKVTVKREDPQGVGIKSRALRAWWATTTSLKERWSASQVATRPI